MTIVKPQDWQPSPGISLEGKALEIATANASASILAGPGAGKTELLAQRAMYLLTTGVCPVPKRILAISFKVDAARNLQNRVEKRCSPELAARFESLTLHSFAKRIVDQFREALPTEFQPSSDYRVIFPNRDIWDDFGNAYSADVPSIRGFNNAQLAKIVHERVPETTLEDATTNQQKIRRLWWNHNLSAVRSNITFDMIMLLAAYIIRREETIKSALQNTYTQVFLDEFQDVTDQQYDLVKAAFLNSEAVITAVGDSNQAIMRWAGAKADIFDRYEYDFNAESDRLLFNFRSNKAIVDLINSLAETFDDDYVETEAARKDDPVPEDATEGWVFETRDDEGRHLAEFIENELAQNENMKPSDIVILARIRVDDVENRIRADFENKDIKIRNEARTVGGIAIQDLVKERIYEFLFAVLKLATNVRVGNPFQACRDIVADIRGIDINTDRGHSDSLIIVRALIEGVSSFIGNREPNEVSVDELTDAILAEATPNEFRRAYREYGSGDRLLDAISGFKEFLQECTSETATWENCISNMEGDDSVRLMTIHKSKGLEYHTVIFLEFNDDAFWGNDDDVNVFFVALSRAREKIRFSFAKDSRGSRNVKDFADKLQKSGVKFLKK
ncbi:UvrD-helicase domain-containing protein [Maritalea sp.]|uniref:UvrD-helicase domain-containing protein n=1 Tax=Maritalea sp. TaxID=2003361 RepID=UPI003EF392AF